MYLSLRIASHHAHAQHIALKSIGPSNAPGVPPRCADRHPPTSADDRAAAIASAGVRVSCAFVPSTHRLRRNIVITGASSGLGAGMAREFAKRGRNLALCARRVDLLRELRAELLADNPRISVEIRQLDVNDHGRVFDVFAELADELGRIDRVIVNAGIGNGQPIGTSRFDANLRTAQTNFLGALAQCEAAMELFRATNSGHLVVVSSIAALRGFPGNSTVYAATKAAVAALAEGIRADVMRTPIAVTTLFPGFIDTPLIEDMPKAPFRVSAEKGCRAMVSAIEDEPATARVPVWPWAPIGFVLKRAPLSIIARLG
ncbi:MAG: SDR family oxidoreductase [Sciscionella sp.]|nr:SDR family oxidoreductase [Sciscionella sp.]